MNPTSTKFTPIITPGGTAGDKSLGMGQHKYVVLRRIAEFGVMSRVDLFNSLSMSDAHTTEALDCLLADGMVENRPDNWIAVTDAGAAALA